MGKIIYQPKGKAGEYSKWAANFFNGCSGKCTYCYNRKGIVAKVLGGDTPSLKKSLKTLINAIIVFKNESLINQKELREHGLHLNFVSDPCLPETFELNFAAINFCKTLNINLKILTKQTWWLNDIDIELLPNNVAYGFTLTGHDELEPGCATNQQRIEAMEKLHNSGFKTWASIEPVIDIESSFKMLEHTHDFCDLYKIGLLSGKKYDKNELEEFIHIVNLSFSIIKTPVYFKDSLLQQAGIKREDLPSNCVTRDYNLFDN